VSFALPLGIRHANFFAFAARATQAGDKF